MHTLMKSKIKLLLSTGILLTATACHSTGANRISLVGEPGPQGQAGIQGEQGEAGAQGEQGSQGAQGEAGDDGATVNGTQALAIGGLIGEDGLAGTGLLANTGDPNSNPTFVASLERESGETVIVASDGLSDVASAIDEQLPGDIPVAGAVVDVLAATGQALADTGNGEGYLVDGLVAAPGSILTAGAGGATLVGGGDGSLIGASLLSSDAGSGDLLGVNIGSGGEAVALNGALGEGAEAALAPITDPLTDISGGALASITDGGDTLTATLQDATSTLGGLGGDTALAPAVTAVTDVVDMIGGIGSETGSGDLSGALGDTSGALDGVSTGGDALAPITDIADGLLAGGGGDALAPVTDAVDSALAGVDGGALTGLLGGATQ